MKYEDQESFCLEFKIKVPKYQQIIKTVIGFCNHLGGKVVIGVDDNGEILGVSENEATEVMSSIQQAIYQSCTPPILPAVYTQRIQDKLLVVIEVSMGMNKPYFLTREGLTSGTYIRVGAHTQKASPEVIHELQWQAKGYSLDELPVYQARKEDLKDEPMATFFGERAVHMPSSQLEDMMLHYKILMTEHMQVYPTLAGILLFGKNPQHFLSESFVICTHFKGIMGREVLSTRDCTGTIFEQLKDAMAFIENRLNKKFVIKKIHRDEILEIPLVALREVVINALIHRHYQVPGPCKIAIYDDRVEIFSPGAFPGPLHDDELEFGITYIRNRVIARVCREAGLVEKLGSGFITLFSSYRAAGLPEPKVINGSDYVKCILPREMSATQQGLAKSDNYKDQINRMLDSGAEIGVKDVIEYCQVSRATASRIMHHLVTEGILLKTGKGPSTRYQKK